MNSVASNEVKMSPKGHISADDKVVDDDLSSVSVEVLVSTYVRNALEVLFSFTDLMWLSFV